jgi:DNA-binding NarL/FixJ family response regulator
MTRATLRQTILIDPYPLWLDIVEQVLGRVGVEVVARTSSPDEALDLVERHSPELVVAELSRADGGAEAWLATAFERFPELKVVVLSERADPEEIEGALFAGAIAYVLKSSFAEDLVSVVRQTFEQSSSSGRTASPWRRPAHRMRRRRAMVSHRASARF